MPEDAAWRTGCDVAFEDVQIRAADRGEFNLHDRIAWLLNFWFRAFFNRLESGAAINKRLHSPLHIRFTARDRTRSVSGDYSVGETAHRFASAQSMSPAPGMLDLTFHGAGANLNAAG